MSRLLGALVVYVLASIVALGLKLSVMPELEITWTSVFGIFMIMAIWGLLTIVIVRGVILELNKRALEKLRAGGAPIHFADTD